MSSITRPTVLDELLEELGAWEANYDVQRILAELEDSYHLTVEGRSLYDVPADELLDICRTYDRTLGWRG